MKDRKIKILAIDDKPDNLLIIRALIREIYPEAVTITAMNGKSGLELAAAEDPDVILLDIVMPEIDGFAVCEKLKADAALADIPVVFVTANRDDRESRIRALEVGGEAFLAKPIDESELTAQLRAMVKIKTANRERRDEQKRLTALVEEQTLKLKQAHAVTLNLLEDLRKENEARKKSEAILKESEARLRQSEKMDAIGQLAGGIAHDFNNVLGGIIGYTDMSLEYAEQGSILEQNLLQVLKAAERAKHLVKQILTFSRQGNPQMIVTLIQPVVKEALELLRASVPSSVIIESFLSDDAKPVRADPTTIHEALLNLATNAVHAMRHKGSLTVRVFSERLENALYGQIRQIAPGEYTVIEVADTGSGMDAVTLSKAFEPFFTTKAVGEGTGMGLSVVLGIVQSHNGDVRVTSEVGKGTTFAIYIPVAQTPAESQEAEAAPRKPAGTERILFVDDEEMLVEMAVDLLSRLGYSVNGMTSSREALEFLREKGGEIDILITDQTMPGMTGIELAQEALTYRPDLPIILCTGYSSQITPETAAAAGIGRFVMKPYGALEISNAIRAVLDERAPCGTAQGGDGT